MKAKITRLLLTAVLTMCCTVMAWADLGTPPNNEIWYTLPSKFRIEPQELNKESRNTKAVFYYQGHIQYRQML